MLLAEEQRKREEVEESAHRFFNMTCDERQERYNVLLGCCTSYPMLMTRRQPIAEAACTGPSQSDSTSWLPPISPEQFLEAKAEDAMELQDDWPLRDVWQAHRLFWA
jgi:hypothetical protein